MICPDRHSRTAHVCATRRHARLSPPGLERPSIVVTSAPSRLPTGVTHERRVAAVHVHRAGPALGDPAPGIGACEPALVAQEPEQRQGRIAVELKRFAVHREADHLHLSGAGFRGVGRAFEPHLPGAKPWQGQLVRPDAKQACRPGGIRQKKGPPVPSAQRGEPAGGTTRVRLPAPHTRVFAAFGRPSGPLPAEREAWSRCGGAARCSSIASSCARSFPSRRLSPRLARIPPRPNPELLHGLDPNGLSGRISSSRQAGPRSAPTSRCPGLGRAQRVQRLDTWLSSEGLQLILRRTHRWRSHPTSSPDRSPPCSIRTVIPDGRTLALAKRHVGACVSLLIGGPTPTPISMPRIGDGSPPSSRRWCRTGRAASPSSPRPARLEAAYAGVLPLVARNPGTVSAIDYRIAGPDSIETAFDCDLILVTSDSMSMTTEAALSRRLAIALAPRRVKPNKDDEAIEGLACRELAGRAAARPRPTPGALVAAAVALRPIAHNHLDRLADLLTAVIVQPACRPNGPVSVHKICGLPKRQRRKRAADLI